MNAAYIDPDPNCIEQQLSNGLVKGHAYTITKVTEIEKNKRFKDEKVKLIQIRNPWGKHNFNFSTSLKGRKCSTFKLIKPQIN